MPTPRYIKIKTATDKEKILTATREKQLFTSKGTHKRLSADISAEILQVKRMTLYFQRDERKKKHTIKNTFLSKAIIQVWRRDEEFQRQAKAKGVQDH